MTTWFSSDQHFGHRNIIDYCNRPFSSVEQMNRILVQNHNRFVQPDDDFICVGDFSLSMAVMEQITPQLQGNLFLVPGNHDRCWPHHTSAKSKRASETARTRYREAGWTVFPVDHEELGPDGVAYNVSHLPYEEDERHGDRFRGQHPVDNGNPLICGHVHNLWHTHGRQFNVGVDVNDFMPVSFETIIEWRKTLGEAG